jgi:DNA (cytosine-5)-methyltransferase 1
MNSKKTCVDLFAGAGGMALGLERAGFDVVAAVEKDDVASLTYKRNILAAHPGAWTAFGSEEGDIRNVDPVTLAFEVERQGVDRVDLVAGGPPCQGFSNAGRGRVIQLDGEKTSDSRNSLVMDFCRVVEVLRPRAVLIENVTGMLSLHGVNHADLACQQLENLGYRVRATVLNAAWYGVPQNRERLFIVGLASDVPTPERWFPTPRHSGRGGMAAIGAQMLENARFSSSDFVEYVWPSEDAALPVTVRDAISDLPSFTSHLEAESYSSNRDAHRATHEYGDEPSDFARLMREWTGSPSPHVQDHYCRYTPRDFETFARMEELATYPRAVEIAAERYREAVESWNENGGVGMQPVPDTFIPPYPLGSFDERWKKLSWDQPSWTVTAHLSKDCYSHIHPDSDQARTISIREAARLQSFHDLCYFEGNTGDCFRQIGNAVPPLLAHAIGEHLVGLLETPLSRTGFTWRRRQPPLSLWSLPA